MAKVFRLTAPEPAEQTIHESCAALFERLVAPPTVWAFYPAGAIKLTPAQSARLVRMGLKRGFPDFIFWHNGDTFGLELKNHDGDLTQSRTIRTKRGSPRFLIGQRDRFKELLASGWRDIAIARSPDAALDQLEKWGISLRGRISV